MTARPEVSSIPARRPGSVLAFVLTSCWPVSTTTRGGAAANATSSKHAPTLFGPIEVADVHLLSGSIWSEVGPDDGGRTAPTRRCRGLVRTQRYEWPGSDSDPLIAPAVPAIEEALSARALRGLGLDTMVRIFAISGRPEQASANTRSAFNLLKADPGTFDPADVAAEVPGQSVFGACAYLMSGGQTHRPGFLCVTAPRRPADRLARCAATPRRCTARCRRRSVGDADGRSPID